MEKKKKSTESNKKYSESFLTHSAERKIIKARENLSMDDNAMEFLTLCGVKFLDD